ncbi:MAG: hypothetical protein Q8K32_12730 [Archangium sp.]|nr:hypothetical protein [Archangium sp.]
MTPFEPIPERTHVGGGDRLLGATIGAYRVLEHVTEGRLGTVYRAQEIASGTPVTLEVLRTGRVGNDEEARAANAIGCAGIAEVQAYGQLPDERRYRVMERLDGESLEQVLLRGPLEAREVVRVLNEVASVLQASHAWAITHGLLGPSSVWRVNGGVKLIDFGLVKAAAREVDLQALGALGFALLAGKELEGAPPVLGPEPLHRLLRALFEKRVVDATVAKRELEQMLIAAPARPARRTVLPSVLVGFAIAVGVFAMFFMSKEQVALPVVEVADPAADPLIEEELIEPEEAPVVQDVVAPRPLTRVVKQARPVPGAQALQELTSKLEAQLRKKARPGDDLDQALFVLNKQRLRLTGNPSEAERKEVARQLAGWRRSYLQVQRQR